MQIDGTTFEINYETAPVSVRGTLQRYLENHIPAGSFMNAVLSNDLRESFATADDFNRYELFDIVKWLYNEAPGSCWGSPEKVKMWLERGRNT